MDMDTRECLADQLVYLEYVSEKSVDSFIDKKYEGVWDSMESFIYNYLKREGGWQVVIEQREFFNINEYFWDDICDEEKKEHFDMARYIESCERNGVIFSLYDEQGQLHVFRGW